MTVSIEQAQLKLAELIQKSAEGEPVVISQDGKAVAEIVPLQASPKRRGFGCLKGKIRIIADDDEHLRDFKEYME